MEPSKMTNFASFPTIMQTAAVCKRLYHVCNPEDANPQPQCIYLNNSARVLPQEAPVVCASLPLHASRPARHSCGTCRALFTHSASGRVACHLQQIAVSLPKAPNAPKKSKNRKNRKMLRQAGSRPSAVCACSNHNKVL